MFSRSTFRGVLGPSLARKPKNGTVHIFSRIDQKSKVRNFSLHEYHSNELMKSYGINTANGYAVTTPEEARAATKKIGGRDWVVKAQILAGGRGKGNFDNGFRGGVQVASTPEKVAKIASKMLGHRLITKQTGPNGHLVNTVFVTERYYVRREVYLAIMMDRSCNGPMVIASSVGGMDIEQIIAEDPASLIKIPIDISLGLTDEQVLEIASHLSFEGSELFFRFKEMLLNLYRFFMDKDITLLEINPLVETFTSSIVCLDSKVNFDDNASYRQSEINELRDNTEMDPREVTAAEHNLNYIALDGNIACLVNGAGLAMATMDIIKHYGGEPANFLDIGGGSSEKQIKEAFKIINSDNRVQAIFVNIFAGIVRCDMIASGIISAAQEINVKKPIVFRLQGTNVKTAKELINSCNIRIIPADDLDQAAQQCVNVAKIRELAKKTRLDVSFELPI